MLNTAPIFINCLSRGGSNIFWNIFLSHPDVCSPIYETLEIFRTDPRSPTWAGYYVALLGGQPRLFDQWLLRPRRHVPGFVQAYIDRTLYQRKLLTFSDDEMKYKYEAQPYTLDEVQAARLAAKGCTPIDDVRSSARYRKGMVYQLTKKALQKTWERLVR